MNRVGVVMRYILLVLLTASVAVPSPAVARDFVKPIQSVEVEKGPSYDELHDEALFNCPWAKMTHEKENIISQLIEIEKSFNPPPKMRGMLLAAACMESGYNPSAKGDRKFSKSKKKPMAIGLLQQWPIYEKMYPGMDRTNPKDAANTWMKHIIKMIPRVKRDCKYRTDAKIWLAAWVTGIRSKKVGGRCNERPLHYRLLQRWHKNIKKARKAAADCEGQNGCGC
jgi:hypothetical protein